MPIVELQTANGSQNPSVTTFVRYISLMRSLENDIYEWQIEGQIKKKDRSGSLAEGGDAQIRDASLH